MAATKSFLIILLVGFVYSEEEKFQPCVYKDNEASCCINANVHGQDYKTCLGLGFNPNEMRAVAALHFNDQTIVIKEAKVGRFCAPLPAPLAMLEGCLNVYWADYNVRQKSVDVCFVFEIPKILQLRFDCYRIQDGKFQHHTEHEPKDHGIVNIGLDNGKPTFEIHGPKGLGKGKN